ncbi:hypothetical protein B0H34DRAFT_859408 [Crassisporium funariophilum]|nr:hypothetical protein B0H34DRAFT_859408 [Crassisporium funariophilum]
MALELHHHQQTPKPRHLRMLLPKMKLQHQDLPRQCPLQERRGRETDEKGVYSFCSYTVDLRTNGFNNAPENEKTTPAAKSLTYILAIPSAEELKKPTSRQQAKTVSLTLASNEPWDTLKAQLLVKINSALSPAKIDFADYKIKYYILRILPKPGLELETDQQYQDLIKRSQDIKGNTPTISVVVRQLTSRVAEDAGEKENVEATAMLASKGNKRTCRDPETLPGNVAKNSNIQCLQEQWKCQKQQSTCVGVYCFPDADTGEHLPLSHEQLDCWALAMLKGEESATLYKPPNHRLFNTKRTALLPVLQRRIEAQNQKNTPPTQPVFNLTLGNELVGLFRQPAKALAPAPVPAPAPMPILDPAPAPVSNHHIPVGCPFLLPPSRSPGTEMSLSTFCTTHELGDAILACLDDNCYKKSSTVSLQFKSSRRWAFVSERLLLFVLLLIHGLLHK